MLQELCTRHKSTVAEFLVKNYDWVSYALSEYTIMLNCTFYLSKEYIYLDGVQRVFSIVNIFGGMTP